MAITEGQPERKFMQLVVKLKVASVLRPRHAEVVKVVSACGELQAAVREGLVFQMEPASDIMYVSKDEWERVGAVRYVPETFATRERFLAIAEASCHDRPPEQWEGYTARLGYLIDRHLIGKPNSYPFPTEQMSQRIQEAFEDIGALRAVAVVPLAHCNSFWLYMETKEKPTLKALEQIRKLIYDRLPYTKGWYINGGLQFNELDVITKAGLRTMWPPVSHTPVPTETFNCRQAFKQWMLERAAPDLVLAIADQNKELEHSREMIDKVRALIRSSDDCDNMLQAVANFKAKEADLSLAEAKKHTAHVHELVDLEQQAAKHLVAQKDSLSQSNTRLREDIAHLQQLKSGLEHDAEYLKRDLTVKDPRLLKLRADVEKERVEIQADIDRYKSDDVVDRFLESYDGKQFVALARKRYAEDNSGGSSRKKTSAILDKIHGSSGLAERVKERLKQREEFFSDVN
jgi:hypothetical protein